MKYDWTRPNLTRNDPNRLTVQNWWAAEYCKMPETDERLQTHKIVQTWKIAKSGKHSKTAEQSKTKKG